MLGIFTSPSKPKKQQAGLKLLALRLHADWCENSKALYGAYENLKNKFDGQDILFVTLDLTNRTTRHQAALLANALGVHELVVEYDETGVILLISEVRLSKQTTTKKIKGILERTMSFDEMSTTILSLIKE